MTETTNPVMPGEMVLADGRVSCQVYEHGQPSHHEYRLADISEILKEEGTLVWLDVVDPSMEDLALLQEEFDLHPLAVEDAVQAHERPKIEAFGHYYFVIVQATTLQQDEVIFHEIAIFVGKKFLVTVRHDPVYRLEEIKRRWQSHPERLSGGGFLLYTILDTVVDGYLPVAELFEDHVDVLEERLFADRHMDADVLPRIFFMKKQGQQFRHAVTPMRDILNPIIRGDLALFSHDEMVYFRDVYDHVVRVIDQLDSVRDLVNSVLEIQLSVAAARQNEVSKQLTLIATIFLPLSFIVGFFGQNFGFLVRDIGSTPAFWLLGIGTELLTIIVMLIYFKRKGWF